MRVYLAVTGLAFTLLTLAHIWRVTIERHLIRDPFFVCITLISTALAAWSARLFWRAPQS